MFLGRPLTAPSSFSSTLRTALASLEEACEGGGSHQLLSIHLKGSRIQLPNEPKIVKIGEVSREFGVGNWQQERGGEEGRQESREGEGLREGRGRKVIRGSWNCYRSLWFALGFVVENGDHWSAQSGDMQSSGRRD